MSEKKSYRLDKTAFSAQTLEEANNHYGFWSDKSLRERLNAAFYLISQAYNVTSETRLNKTSFSKRKHA